jgi:hypothetical protein
VCKKEEGAMDKEKNVSSVEEKRLLPCEKAVMEEELKLKEMGEGDQWEYINQTAYMFAFLRDAVIEVFRVGAPLHPTEDTMFGMQLIFDYIETRIRASASVLDT